MQLIIRRNNRMDSLDAIRGIAILAMVFYHSMYDVCDIFGYNLPLFNYLKILEPPFAGLFILLAGVSSRYSHNNLKRGARTFALGMLVTAITLIFMPSQSIYFGILHFMGCAILLFELVRPAADRIPVKIALPLWTLLFAVTFMMPDTGMVGIPGLFGVVLPNFLRNTPNLYPFGFPDSNFFSADYFPMIPWFFLFLIGTIVGVPIKEHRLPEKFYTVKIPFLAAAGRNTLIIYVLHQPIVYGLLWLLFNIMHLG
jgi:uncharacterized membrane protein